MPLLAQSARARKCVAHGTDEGRPGKCVINGLTMRQFYGIVGLNERPEAGQRTIKRRKKRRSDEQLTMNRRPPAVAYVAVFCLTMGQEAGKTWFRQAS